MKRIDVFVESVYQNIGGNNKEIQELKDEMRNHLMESVHELKLEGNSEQKAIDIAIERFGEETELRSIVGQLFEVQKLFAKRILYLAIGSLLLTLSVFLFHWQNAESNAHELSIIATDIFDELENTAAIPSELSKEIEQLVLKTNHIVEVSIYDSNKIRREGINFVSYNTDVAEAEYQYERTLWAPKWLGVDFFPYGNGNEQWYVEMRHRSFGTLFTIILFVGIAIYWTLFTIWATVNAYHQKRLNILWVIAFGLLNVLGFIIYHFSTNKNQQRISSIKT
ncbi:permease prefix domain 1-containing protein [Pseudalkalibacillus sp. R45]|uniref:permease prefix domain 1-containing protein n=1 Tax=Pseudalkalibacillus sp. R45 TaxID=3457433 RepID=UPI003FCD0BB3